MINPALKNKNTSFTQPHNHTLTTNSHNSRDKTEFNYFKTTICTWVTHSSEIHNSRAGNHYQMITNV